MSENKNKSNGDFEEIINKAQGNALEFRIIKKGKEDRTTPYEQRNQSYADLAKYYAEDYNARHIQKKKLKTWFFILIMAMLCLIVLSCVCVIVICAIYKNDNLAIILGAIGTLITSFLAIPTIIANYLFPKDEDNNIIDMVKELFKFDNNYLPLINKNKNTLENNDNKENDENEEN